MKRAAEFLKGSGVPVCTVIGFPLGATLPDVKAYEARRSIFNGAREVDMVINIGALKSGDDCTVEDDITGCSRRCSRERRPLQSDHRNRLAYRRRKGPGLPCFEKCRCRFRKDIDRIFEGRRHSPRCCADAADGRKLAWCKGVRRRKGNRGREGDVRGRSNAYRGERWRKDRPGSERDKIEHHHRNILEKGTRPRVPFHFAWLACFPIFPV